MSLQLTMSAGQVFGLRAVLLSCVGGLLCVLVGCAESKDRFGVDKTVPVSGKVTFATKLPKGATAGVTFMPEGATASATNIPPSGVVDEQGNYTLNTGTKTGAPPGKYKVVVKAAVPENPKDPYSPTKSVINESYSDAKSTPFAVEVSEHPAAGAYDLNVK